MKEFLWAVFVVGVAMFAFARPAESTPEIAEMEDRSCLTCHTALGRAELNAAGEYYREHRTLEGYPGELPPRQLR